jgi:hypothetical protein
MRARVPDWVVWRIWWRGGCVDGGEGVAVSMSSLSLLVKVSVVDGRERCDWTRWRDVGKWPVWNVDLCRRRDPASDFGSLKVS